MIFFLPAAFWFGFGPHSLHVKDDRRGSEMHDRVVLTRRGRPGVRNEQRGAGISFMAHMAVDGYIYIYMSAQNSAAGPAPYRYVRAFV